MKNLLTLQGKQTRSDDSWMLTVCFHFKFCFGFVFAFLVVVGVVVVVFLGGVVLN